MPNRYVSTRIFATFHSDVDGNFDSSKVSAEDVPFEVVSLSTDKSLGEASGSWTLGVKAKRPGTTDLAELFRDPEGVWCKLGFFINGTLFDVMLGNVDTVKEGVTRGQKGERVETLTVTGRDHGKVFETTEMYINVFERDGIVPAVSAYKLVHENLQGRPHDFVLTLVREWVGNNEISDSQWKLPLSLGGLNFYDLLNKTTISRRTRGVCQDPHIFNPDQMGQKLWDALTEFSNGVLNELWTDLAPDPIGENQTRDDPANPDRRIDVRQVSGLRPALYLRERPFPAHVEYLNTKRKWEGLPTHVIEPSDVKARNITKGGAANRYNFWLLDGSGFQSRSVGLWAQIQDSGGQKQGKPGGYPIYDLDSIRRFGLRRFSQSTKFLPLTDSNIGELAYTVSGKWLQIIHDWYVVAPLERTGTIQTSRIMPWIRVGHRIREFTRSGQEIIYYVEGVSHAYQYPQGGTTTLTLTRGEPHGRDFLEEVYEAYDVEKTVNDLETDHPGLDDEASAEEREAVREAPTPSAASAAASGVGGAPLTVEGASAGEPGVSPPRSETGSGSDGVTPTVDVQSSEGANSQVTDPDMNHDQISESPEREFEEAPAEHPVRTRSDQELLAQVTAAGLAEKVLDGTLTPEEANELAQLAGIDPIDLQAAISSAGVQ